MDFQTLFDMHTPLDAQAELEPQTASIPAGPGTALFVAADNHPILLTYGANLRSIVRNRLADPPQEQVNKKTPLRPITAAIYSRWAFSPFQTELDYFHLAKALYPDTWRQFFPQLHAIFIHVNPADTFPSFRRTDTLHAPGFYWGPFADKTTADRWIDTLECLFSLCRRPHLLGQAPHAVPCPYAQMNLCVTVCDGSASPALYHQHINQAVEFLNTNDTTRLLEQLREQMKQAAADRLYEKAHQLKTLTDRLLQWHTPACRWVSPLEKFVILTLQTGPKIKIPNQRALEPTLIPFLITAGGIRQLDAFELNQIEQKIPELCDSLPSAAPRTIDPIQIAWAARFLYRKDNKGIFIAVPDIQSPHYLIDLAVKTFAPSPKTHCENKKPKLDAYSLSENSSPEDPIG